MFISRDGLGFLDRGGVWCNSHICLVYVVRSDCECSDSLDILIEVKYDVAIMSTQ